MTCCKLSRENWITQSMNSRVYSTNKWQTLLTEITNIEFAIEEIRSIRKKLFPHANQLDSKSVDIVSKLLKGLEVELDDGLNNPIASRVFGLFAEAKKAQNELSLDGGGAGGVGSGGDRTPTNLNASLPNPFEKQFTLRVSGNTQTKGVGGPQFLRLNSNFYLVFYF